MVTREVKGFDTGKWIKEKRKAMKLNQAQFARMIPIHENALSRYETGDKYPPLDILEKICEICGAEIVIREHGTYEDTEI